jgi:putative ABC transport system permease protein
MAAPMFTLFSVLSLASGVALTTAVYSVVDTQFLRDLGVPDPDRAAFIVASDGGRRQYGALSAPDFEDLRRAQRSFGSLSATAPIMPSVASTTTAEVLAAEAVDGLYFPTLGISTVVGRTIDAQDDAMAARVAVLSNDFWRGRFAGDPQAIGRSIRINGQTFEIVGVAPARYGGLYGPLRRTQLWIPLSAEAALGTSQPLAGRTAREHTRLLVFGRLANNVAAAQASAELTTLAARFDREFPSASMRRGASTDRDWSATAMDDMHRDENNSLRRFGMTIVALVGLVLLVACTNLANLVLARGAARQGELAVRMAMGASRARLVWEQCIESLLLAAGGAVASYVMFQVVAAMMTIDFNTGPVRALTIAIRPALDARAIAVGSVSTLLAILVFGLEPAIQLARTADIRSALAAGATGIRPRVGRQRMVIRWQVAIAAGFFIIATMFIRQTLNLAAHDSGVELDRIAVASLNFDNGVWNDDRIGRAIDRVLQEGRADTALEAVSASAGLPFGVPPKLQLAVAMPDDLEALTRPPLPAVAATPGFFKALGIAMVRGRAFTDADALSATPVVILSEMTARRMFGSADAVGQSIAMRGGDARSVAEIVGVASDTDVRFIYGDRQPLIYVPFAQRRATGVTIVARSAAGAARAVPALREAIRRADPDLSVDVIGTGRAVLTGRFELLRSAGMGTLYLGAFTLLLSMVGLFGVQLHAVSYRTREIGVRMSVGASARQIKVMVIKDGYRPVVEGLLLGLWGGLAGRVLARAYLDVEVAVVDPVMLWVTPVPLLLAAFCACYWPAARAAKVDPTVALRCE